MLMRMANLLYDPGVTGSQQNGNGGQKNAEIAFETLGEWLEQDGWHPERIEQMHAYRMGLAGKHGRYLCVAEVRMQLQQLLFYVLVAAKVPEPRRLAVSEAIARANWGLRIGNLEFDFTDGEIRYKSSLDFEGELLSPTLIRNAIYPAVETMDHYLPALMAVAYGDKEPAEAIADVEGAD